MTESANGVNGPPARPIKEALETFLVRLAELGYVTDEVTISLPFNALYMLWNELSPMPIPDQDKKDASLELYLNIADSWPVRVRGLS